MSDDAHDIVSAAVDETETGAHLVALLKNIEVRVASALKAKEGECERLKATIESRDDDWESLLTSVAKSRNDAESSLSRMKEALELVRGIIVDGAMTGFNYKDGDWTERLFASQAVTHAALSQSVEPESFVEPQRESHDERDSRSECSGEEIGKVLAAFGRATTQTGIDPAWRAAAVEKVRSFLIDLRDEHSERRSEFIEAPSLRFPIRSDISAGD